MVRTIAAVVAGYVDAVAVTIAGIFVSWAIFGVEGAFAENSTLASTPWAITSCVIGFAAAAVAGATAALVGRHATNLPVKVLAGLMLVLGLVIAARTMGVEPPPVPEEWANSEVSFMEAGEYAVSPTWYYVLIPFIGAAGVLLGGRLVAKPE
jgi:uncharacterized membrane protein YoaK (UPF0700 family)